MSTSSKTYVEFIHESLVIKFTTVEKRLSTARSYHEQIGLTREKELIRKANRLNRNYDKTFDLNNGLRDKTQTMLAAHILTGFLAKHFPDLMIKIDGYLKGQSLGKKLKKSRLSRTGQEEKVPQFRIRRTFAWIFRIEIK